MSADNYQFIQTYNLFKEHLSGYPKNPTYEQWKDADADDRACLLFVTFFKEITLAWNNAVIAPGIVYVSQEDGVSTVLQYLMKNVDKILDDPKRYTHEYIYIVSKNCLLKLWQTRGTDQKRCECEIGHEVTVDSPKDCDAHVDLWDLVPSIDDDVETQQTKEAIWTIIRHMGPKAEKVVNHLINPGDTLHKISKSSSERPIDRLADVVVSKSEYEAIVSELRVKLEPYRDLLLHF